MIVTLTAEAETDLQRITSGIAASSPRRALEHLRELRERCESLASFPEAFPIVPRYERQRVRRRVYGKYLIFYRIDRDRVVILHVLHGARDFATILSPDAD